MTGRRGETIAKREPRPTPLPCTALQQAAGPAGSQLYLASGYPSLRLTYFFLRPQFIIELYVIP